MPLVVDKEAIRLEILEAFQRLSEKKPLTDISLRAVAAEAGMSHTKVLRYFGNKTGLHVASVHWASSLLYKGMDAWFQEHKRSEFASEQEMLDAFFGYIAEGGYPAATPRDVVMTCALGAYSEDIRNSIKEEMKRLNSALTLRLSEAFGKEISPESVSAVFLLYCGVYFAGYNGALFSAPKPIWGIQELLEKKPGHSLD